MPSKSIEELKQEAELLYPMPFNACVYMQARIMWKRDRWVKQQAHTP